jgi:PKD repeat protein
MFTYSYTIIDSCNFSNQLIGIGSIDFGEINHCNFLNNGYGLEGFYVDGKIENCTFDHNDRGIDFIHAGLIDSCLFINNQYGVYSWGGNGFLIKNSIIDSNSTCGLWIAANDTVIKCQINNNAIGIQSGGGTVTRNRIENNNIGIKANYGSIYCNKICNNTFAGFYYNSSVNNYNVSNNYWCTADSLATTAVIYDGYDNVLYGLVDFMPLDTTQCYLNGFCSANFILYPDSVIPHQYWVVNLASGVPPLTYLWSWGDGTTDTIALPSHTYGTSGFYTICLTITDSTGCSSMYCDSSYLSKNSDAMVYVNVIAQTGITVCSINKSFLIYPNPASDYLTLKFAQNTSNSEIKIYNLLGELKSTSRKSSTESTIDISDLSNGVYIIEVTTEKNIMRQKFIKQ